MISAGWGPWVDGIGRLPHRICGFTPEEHTREHAEDVSEVAGGGSEGVSLLVIG